MGFKHIVEDVHRAVDAHRASIGLPPWDWGKPSKKVRAPHGSVVNNKLFIRISILACGESYIVKPPRDGMDLENYGNAIRNRLCYNKATAIFHWSVTLDKLDKKLHVTKGVLRS